MVCDEHGIGGSGEYFGGNGAHLERIDVFYHEASGGKYVPRTVFFDLEPGVIGAVTLSRRLANSSARKTS
jgi:tubulin beta